jgi:hypothetical protein
MYSMKVLGVILCILLIMVGIGPPTESIADEAVVEEQPIIEHVNMNKVAPSPAIFPESIPYEVAVEEEAIEPRYDFSDDEVYLLAQLLCGDASKDGDGEYDFVWSAKHTEVNYAEVCKVLCVVMNRVRSDLFPNTVTAVVNQVNPRQFRAMETNLYSEPDEIAIEIIGKWCDAYDRWDTGVQTIPESHLYFEAGPNNTNVTRENW